MIYMYTCTEIIQLHLQYIHVHVHVHIMYVAYELYCGILTLWFQREGENPGVAQHVHVY